MITPSGHVPHEIPAGGRVDETTFDHHGHVLARAVIDPQVLRTLRAPLIEALTADGCIEGVADDQDRFLWRGDADTFDRAKYRSLIQGPVDEVLMRSGIAFAAI